MAKKVAELLASVRRACVKPIYGVVGDSLNGITDTIRIKKNIHWYPLRHHGGGLSLPQPEAHLTGKLAVLRAGAAGLATCT